MVHGKETVMHVRTVFGPIGDACLDCVWTHKVPNLTSKETQTQKKDFSDSR